MNPTEYRSIQIDNVRPEYLTKALTNSLLFGFRVIITVFFDHGVWTNGWCMSFIWCPCLGSRFPNARTMLYYMLSGHTAIGFHLLFQFVAKVALLRGKTRKNRPSCVATLLLFVYFSIRVGVASSCIVLTLHFLSARYSAIPFNISCLLPLLGGRFSVDSALSDTWIQLTVINICIRLGWWSSSGVVGSLHTQRAMAR